VKLESIFLNAFIDAHEGRHVITIDIKGAFLKAQIMCEFDDKLRVNGDGILYLKCLKALYGHIEAARLFYDDLNRTIQEDMEFK
jgi:hypothetical protein